MITAIFRISIVLREQQTMHETRVRRRLDRLFADLDRPVTNPSVDMPKVHPESESSAAPIAELEGPFLQYEDLLYNTETDLPANSQDPGQNSDELIQTSPKPFAEYAGISDDIQSAIVEDPISEPDTHSVPALYESDSITYIQPNDWMEVSSESESPSSATTELEESFLEDASSVVDSQPTVVADPINEQDSHSAPTLHETDSTIYIQPDDQMEIRSESESPSSGTTELEKPFIEYTNSAVDIEPAVVVTPPVQQELPHVPTLYEADQKTYAQPNHQSEAQPDSAHSSRAVTNVITSPLSHRERDTTDSANPLTEAELSLLTWQAVGIGTVVGTLVTLLIYLINSRLDLFGKLGGTLVAGGEILFGILGAAFNISSRKPRRTLWIGALVWSFIPVFAALIFILLISLVMFSNFFGV